MAITVAIATPSTPICKASTKKRFRLTLIQPDASMAYKGRLVSPLLRSRAAPKLYSKRVGTPAIRICRYSSAASSISGGVSIKSKISRPKVTPKTARKMPHKTATSMEVCTAFFRRR